MEKIFFTFFFVPYVNGLVSSTPPGLCKKDGTEHCCADFKRENAECVPCPAGRFGTNCTESCPPGYFGVFCKTKCDCNDEVCLPHKGCSLPESKGDARQLEKDTNPNTTSDNEIRSKSGVERTGNTPIVVVLSLFIVTAIAVLLVVFFRKRLNICAGTVKLLPQICAVQGNSDDIENITERVGHGTSRMNRDLSTNQSSRHQCTLATEENAYGDINDEASNDYNLLELRLRNVSCMSADLDRLENQGEYVSLNHEGSRKNTAGEETSTKIPLYECVSNEHAE